MLKYTDLTVAIYTCRVSAVLCMIKYLKMYLQLTEICKYKTQHSKPTTFKIPLMTSRSSPSGCAVGFTRWRHGRVVSPPSKSLSPTSPLCLGNTGGAADRTRPFELHLSCLTPEEGADGRGEEAPQL